jgi:hypothetical protein
LDRLRKKREHSMATNDESESIGQDLLVPVEITLVGGTDLTRFDQLFDGFVDDNIEDSELDEFRDMILDVRRTDGKE